MMSKPKAFLRHKKNQKKTDEQVRPNVSLLPPRAADQKGSGQKQQMSIKLVEEALPLASCRRR